MNILLGSIAGYAIGMLLIGLAIKRGWADKIWKWLDK